MSRSSAPPPADLPAVSFSEGEGLRHLHLGDTDWVQGTMRIRSPFKIELDYVQRMMAALLLCRAPLQPRDGAAPPHAVQLGLGAGALTKACHQTLRWRTTAVELNPQVIAACRQWFKLPPDDARLSVLRADAAAWVADPTHAGSVDLLAVDLYDHEAATPLLDDEAFYRDCRSVLAEGGALSVNVFGWKSSLGGSLRKLRAVFGAGQVANLAPTEEGNTVVLAWRDGPLPSTEDLMLRAEAVQALTKLPARRWVRMLQAARPAPPAT